MRKFVIVAVLTLMLPAMVHAQASVTVDPAVLNVGYMNVFDFSMVYQFGQPWGFNDLTAVYSGYDLTLGPNSIGDPNEYWYQCIEGYIPPNCGGPGAPGNKIMEASSYAESTGPLAGQTVTFSGEVLAYSLTSAHTVVAFIRDFAPDFSSFNQSVVTLTATGPFSVSLDTVNDPARHVQWGFQMVGVNVWITDVAGFGSITIGPDYEVGNEDSSWGAIKNQLR